MKRPRPYGPNRSMARCASGYRRNTARLCCLPHLPAFAVRHPAVEVTVSCDYMARNLRGPGPRRVGSRRRLRLEQSGGGRNPLHRSDSRGSHPRFTGSTTSKPLPIAVYRNSTWARDFAFRSLELQGGSTVSPSLPIPARGLRTPPPRALPSPRSRAATFHRAAANRPQRKDFHRSMHPGGPAPKPLSFQRGRARTRRHGTGRILSLWLFLRCMP